MVGMQ